MVGGTKLYGWNMNASDEINALLNKAYTIVDSYGGHVWAEDRVKGDHAQGARFEVMLPAVEKLWMSIFS